MGSERWVRRRVKASATSLRPVCESSGVCCRFGACSKCIGPGPALYFLSLVSLSLIIMFRKLGVSGEREERNLSAGLSAALPPT